jgi:hypothetical protein
VGETGTINFSKVAETCLLKVVRPLRIVAATMFGVADASLYTVLVSMVISSVRAAKDILAISTVVVKIRIVAEPARAPPRVIKRPVSSDDYNPTLRLYRRA